MERKHPTTGTPLTAGTLHVDPNQRSTHINGDPLELTPTEFDVMLYLIRHAGTVVDHHQLITAAWGTRWSTDVAALHAVVHNIRKKLADTGHPPVIRTKRGIGYILHSTPRPVNAPSVPSDTITPMARYNAGDPDYTGPVLFVGLDCETSSAQLATGGRLIQAGAATWREQPGGPIDIYSSLVSHDTLDWDPAAAAVHNIDYDAMRSAPKPASVDHTLQQWLLERGADPEHASIVPIGFNVTSFDLPFFRQALPKTAGMISHRGVDLNSVCFTYADIDGQRTFTHYKNAAKAYANERLTTPGERPAEHDAGYDAAQALLVWWYLKNNPPQP